MSALSNSGFMSESYDFVSPLMFISLASASLFSHAQQSQRKTEDESKLVIIKMFFFPLIFSVIELHQMMRALGV